MITLKEILEDISTGKSSIIYYSANTLWWTHLEEDLKDSTLAGQAKLEEKLSPEKYEVIVGHKFPLDPTGSVLFKATNPIDFINHAKSHATSYGGLEPFLMAHNNNSEGKVLESIEDYKLLWKEKEQPNLIS